MEECPVCHKKHPKAFMAKHIKNRHSEKPGRFHCEMCDKTCTTEEGLKLHKTFHYSGLVFRFISLLAAALLASRRYVLEGVKKVGK